MWGYDFGLRSNSLWVYMGYLRNKLEAGGEPRVTAAHVSVTDHGPGIPDDDLSRIFERFYRAPAAQGKPGAGLGLAIVSSVAHANSGTVEVRTGSTGSTFTLTLPSTSADVPAAGRHQS